MGKGLLAELIADKTRLASFQRQLRTGHRTKHLEDESFVLTANQLSDFFSTASAEELRQSETLVVPYVDFVRYQSGIEAVAETVRNLVRRGVSPRPLAYASLFSSRTAKHHEIAVDLVSELKASSPRDPIVNLVLGEALAGIGNWKEMEELALQCLLGGFNTEWTNEKWSKLLIDNCRIRVGRRYIDGLPTSVQSRSLLELRVRSFENSQGDFPFRSYLLNLDREPRKRKLSNDLLAVGGIHPERVSAIDGMDLPSIALRKLASDPSVYEREGAGAIATAVSHLSIWERFLSTGDEACLIVEDDASPYVHWSFQKETLQVAQKYDLIWANERMSRVLWDSQVPDEGLMAPWEVLGTRPERVKGIGLDCYVLRRAGAEKLLALFEEHGILGHIDGQLAAFSMPTDGQPAATRVQKICRSLQSRVGLKKSVSSVALGIPLVMANDHGVSNTVEISRDKRIVESSLRP